MLSEQTVEADSRQPAQLAADARLRKSRLLLAEFLQDREAPGPFVEKHRDSTWPLVELLGKCFLRFSVAVQRGQLVDTDKEMKERSLRLPSFIVLPEQGDVDLFLFRMGAQHLWFPSQSAPHFVHVGLLVMMIDWEARIVCSGILLSQGWIGSHSDGCRRDRVRFYMVQWGCSRA